MVASNGAAASLWRIERYKICSDRSTMYVATVNTPGLDEDSKALWTRMEEMPTKRNYLDPDNPKGGWCESGGGWIGRTWELTNLPVVTRSRGLLDCLLTMHCLTYSCGTGHKLRCRIKKKVRRGYIRGMLPLYMQQQIASGYIANGTLSYSLSMNRPRAASPA